ncbi:MAG: hypothetical protein IKE73_01000 [Bacilli bacterium]|nr:hypothetical protein [Bacilli bacterium]
MKNKGKVNKYDSSLNKKSIVIIILMSLIIIGLIVNIFLLLNKKETKVIEKCDYYNFDVGKNENIVFLGDSITELYQTKELFSGLPVVNSGFGGYTTKNILDIMNDAVYRYNPTKVFLLIGTNDIGNEGKDEEYVFENIKKIVEEINKNRPNAKVYVESIYPVGDEVEEYEERNKTINSINMKLKDYFSNKETTFIDISNYLKDNDGRLKDDYTKDGIHLTDKAYLAITKLLFPYIYN